jgi:spermidine synthase
MMTNDSQDVMSSFTQRLLVLAGMTSDEDTVLKFCEPRGTSRQTLFSGLLKGTYRKPFLIEDPEYLAMCFTLDGCTQTEMRLDDPVALANEYTRKMMGFLLFEAHPKKILMIGLGGGSLAKYCHQHLPDTELTAVEIDLDVIAMRAHFFVPPDDERFKVINADGAEHVAQMADRGERSDVMLIDAYGPFGIAKSVVGRAFVENARRVLGPEGVFVLNLVADADECKSYVETIRQVFDSPVIVIAMKRGGGNLIVFAGNALLDPHRVSLALRNAERIEDRLGLFFPTLLRQLNETLTRLDPRLPVAPT